MEEDAMTFTELAELLGIPDLGDAEQAAVLDLTRVAAHTSERRYAPLTAYALALTMAADGATAEERLRRVEAATRRLQGWHHGRGTDGDQED